MALDPRDSVVPFGVFIYSFIPQLLFGSYQCPLSNLFFFSTPCEFSRSAVVVPPSFFKVKRKKICSNHRHSHSLGSRGPHVRCKRTTLSMSAIAYCSFTLLPNTLSYN
ncbi:hypothetical protein VNO80_26853 [Phaseolus coccineus]|uniref:Uncharacterized protein n=1 Tax=Phaseolus coccineus TaxID=3886 RepID=A0AAN9LFJ9_PHACN